MNEQMYPLQHWAYGPPANLNEPKPKQKEKENNMIPKTIIITPVLNGFSCMVACQTVVFRTVNELAEAIRAYYNDPCEVEKKYLANPVNKTAGLPCPVDTTDKYKV